MSNSTCPPEAVQAAALADDRPVSELGDDLANKEIPLADRFRVLFTLRNIGGEDGIDAIARGKDPFADVLSAISHPSSHYPHLLLPPSPPPPLLSPLCKLTCVCVWCGVAFEDDSVLLKHEVAYVLGQMKDGYAVETLLTVLSDEDEDVMVRHEAGEALGAIGEPRALDALRKYAAHENEVIAETCELAVALIEWATSEEGKAEAAAGVLDANPYLSVDPAPPAPASLGVDEHAAKLQDKEAPLFERYRALFALRNNGSDPAIQAICDAFDDASALFRHELAYVLGQIQSPLAVDALSTVLKDADEHCMVRHEAAEALGSIADDACLPILQTHAGDEQRVVSESCQVALDMAEYENSGAFEYVQ